MNLPKVDYGFGFNDTSFSDRVLRIEIVDDSLDSNGDCIPNRKNTVVETKTLHINSLLLSANSPFFHKLFKNGMRESQSIVSLRINASEEEALMDIIKFTYSHTLSATTSPDLLDVLTVADKFEVTSCMKYCTELLQKKLVSLESAISYLELPESILVGEVVRPLVDAAKQYLLAQYSNFDESQTQAMDWPLCAVEVLLGGQGLQVGSEDDVFDFVLKWTSLHYPKLEERREILTKRLVKCMCLLCMSCLKLKEALFSPDFGSEEVLKLMIDALAIKIEVPCAQHIHAAKDLAPTKCESFKRIYKLRPIKMVQLDLPQPRCFVYFDLTKEECENLFTSKDIYSQSFSLGGRWFKLSAKCYTKEQRKAFGLFLYMTEGSESCTVDFEFAVMKKSSKEFQTKAKFNNTKLLRGTGFGTCNLLGISWIDFMGEDCEYFIEGILHLRVDFTITNSEN